MLKYKEIMHVSSMHFNYVHISCTHDLPRFHCYSTHSMFIRNQRLELCFDKARALEHQAQRSLPIGINPHIHKHFCLNSSLSFLVCNLLTTWLLIMCSSLLFLSFFFEKNLTRLWKCVLNNNLLLLCGGSFWHIIAWFWKLLCETW
jgi:hypothetical protein